MAQETIVIVNIKRSISSEKRFEQKLYKSHWEGKEDYLRSEGWLPVSEIKEVKTEVVEDGKGKKVVDIVEEEVIEPVVVTEEKDYSKMSLEELRKECDDNDIKYHGASKEEKLISLLTEENK